jgi:hypothetical protein
MTEVNPQEKMTSLFNLIGSLRSVALGNSVGFIFDYRPSPKTLFSQ